MSNLLSDGQPVEVRRLKFLELEDQVPYLDPGPYIHTYVIDDYPQPVAYTLDDYEEIPRRPDRPFSEATEGDGLYERWLQFRLYRAVLTHERNRIDTRETYHVDCAHYIMRTCLSPEDRERIVTPDDYIVLYHLALCPEITEEDIMAILASTFQGYLEGAAVMDLAQEARRSGWFLYSDTTLGAAINTAAFT